MGPDGMPQAMAKALLNDYGRSRATIELQCKTTADARQSLLFAPVWVDNKQPLFVWSGFLAPYRTGAISNTEMLLHGDVWDEGRIRSAQEQIDQLVEFIGDLWASNKQKKVTEQLLGPMRQLARMTQYDTDVLLKQSLEMLQGFQFVGIAKKIDGDRYQVVQVAGSGSAAALLQREFYIGEGLLGRVAATGKGEYLEDASDYLSLGVLSVLAESLQRLFCYPVRSKGESQILFFGGGSETAEPPFSELLPWLAQMYGRYLGLVEDRTELESKAHHSLIRLSTLLDISRYLMMDDIGTRNILYVLVDMSLSIAEGGFAAVLYKNNPGSDQFSLFSRGLPAELSRGYSQELTACYFQPGASGPEFKQPVIRDSAVLGLVLEAPLQPYKQLKGVLSVKLTTEQHYESIKPFFYGFTIVASMALQKADEQSERRDQTIMALNRAVARWDQEAYSYTLQLGELATSFADSLDLTDEVKWSMRNACLLQPYSAEFVAEQGIGAETVTILREAERLKRGEAIGTVKVASSSAITAAQALHLVRLHLEQKDACIAGIDPSLVPLSLQHAFQHFLHSSKVVEQQFVLPGPSAVKPTVSQDDRIKLLPLLTAREMEVLELIGQGHSNKEIAKALFISEHTVKNHISNMFHKLELTDRNQAVALLYEWRYTHASES
ncbi:helix-turn-helix transcriptional regulator [Paenibacillus sp. y28]|uniref:helix-turn-helix transcriptional regulator n=1 Tax=Paenibacillus sp. y28 TaxID=3129110 RepID=UPI003015BF26